MGGTNFIVVRGTGATGGGRGGEWYELASQDLWSNRAAATGQRQCQRTCKKFKKDQGAHANEGVKLSDVHVEDSSIGGSGP